MTKVLLLHAYSAKNTGDGLLVDSAIEFLNECYEDPEITLLASYPNTFADRKCRVLPILPTSADWFKTINVLIRASCFDLVCGVGGGYLRFGKPIESIKTSLVHLPQLLFAAFARTPSIYLPQSIGPVNRFQRPLVSYLLSKIDLIALRDNRSVSELALSNVRRIPDMATFRISPGVGRKIHVDATPVLSVRNIRGQLPREIHQLSQALGEYDTFVQSSVSGNDDRAATATLNGTRELSKDELLVNSSQPRIVVAVRLHAALMAIAAGHYVIHLAYERKGFGAFSDLGLSEWVHNVHNFDSATVASQVRCLLDSKETREIQSSARSLQRSYTQWPFGAY